MSDEVQTTRRERERERHRHEILAAAQTLLSERGLEGLTMDEIARRSEFSVGSLYRFFGSKEDLVEALVVSDVDAFAAAIGALAEAPGPYEPLLDRYLDLHATLAEQNLPLVHFVFSGKRPFPHAGEPSPLLDATRRMVAQLSTLLERGAREGLLGDAPPQTMALVMMSLVDGLGRSAWFVGERDLHSVLPIARRAFLDGFRRR